MLNSQRFATCSHLWPLSVFKHSPVDGSQIFTDLSSLPLASSPDLDQATVLTSRLPLSQMSALLVTALRLSPAEGGRQKKKERPNTQRLAKSKKVTCGPSFNSVRRSPFFDRA